MAVRTGHRLPQVAKSGKTPAGAGPYSASNYYSGWTFSGTTFSACVVAKPTDVAGTYRFAGDPSNGRWVFEQTAANFHMTVPGVAGVPGTTSIQANVVNVFCIGANAGTAYSKANLAALSSIAAAMGGVPAATQIGTGTSFPDTAVVIYEFWFSTTAPSDALFTSVMQRVKTRAGITAW